MLWTKSFWKATAERAIKTAAQFGVYAWGAVTFTNLHEVATTAQAVVPAVIFGAGLSVLTSLASAPFGEPESPSLVKVGE